MADEATTTVPVDAPAPAVAAEPTEPTQTNGATDATVENAEEKEKTIEHADMDASLVEGDKTEVADGAAADAAADGTPSSASKDKKRKSTGGVPEHKSKKLNKKKSMPVLRLECKPGEFYWARLKGYPPWPAVICDEEMLPESLLASRPVSTSRPDGSIRDDFKEGGKNAKERTFPIMFLSTNEFQWMVNVNLTPLDPEECKTLPNTKMTKALQDAYKIASEDHDLEYFKGILRQWQDEEEMFRKAEEEAAIEAERLAAEEAAKAAEDAAKGLEAKDKSKKKAPRKSKAADEDIQMEDADAPKSSKKRKKEAESDAETKPKKTPKVTKINAPKTPNGEEASAKKSATKTKKKVVTAPKMEDPDESKPQLTEEEKLAQREKAVLYLRHRLQKGFLSRDSAPQESEMATMAEFFSQLESYENLEASIIRLTKIHKVLKAIVKLASVPRDSDFSFKKRSAALLEVWNRRMEADGEAAPPSAVEEKKAPETNGDKEASATEVKEMAPAQPTLADAKEEAEKRTEPETEQKTDDNADNIEEKAEEAKTEAPAEPPAAPVEKTADLTNDAKEEADGDATMETAPAAATA